ncbi:MAG: PIG-L deacetylase family protein [Elusimicrobiota bacterium]
MSGSKGASAAAPGAGILEKYRGRKVVFIGAHPDDIELGAGGTVARMAEEGADATMVVVCVPTSLETRAAEAKRAAALLGARIDILFPRKAMRVEDIRSYELIGRIDAIIRAQDPAAVITHAASNSHHDHVLVHKACAAAQRLHFFDMLCFYPNSCHPVTTSFHPQAYIDITRTIERKMAAIDQHATQFRCRGLSTDHYVGIAREYGRLAGVEFAEGLEVSRLNLG